MSQGVGASGGELCYRANTEVVWQRGLLAKRLKAVTDPKDRFDVSLGVNTELLPKPADVDVEGTGADLRAVAPDFP